MNEELTIWEEWSLQIPDFPKHSRLYPLEPVGLGTPYAESIVSYVCRLAEAHCVYPGILILSEIAPFIKEGFTFDSKEGGIDRIFARQTRALNGVGDWTKKLIYALESLTSRKDIQLLTLIVWSEVLSTRELLRPIRAWCPICYENWYLNKQVLYEPLIWAFNSVTLCPYHLHPLQTKCIHCQQTNLTLSWRSRAGYCAKCGEWLGMTSQTQEIEDNKNDLSWGLWVVDNVGSLIAEREKQKLTLPRKRISEVLLTYSEVLTEGNIAKFAEYLGLGHVQTHRWCTGKCIPTLDILLKICFRLEISLLNFLNQKIYISELSRRSVKKYIASNKTVRTPYTKLHDSNEVCRALEAALVEEPPPSLKELAERLGYRKTSALYYHSQKLCQLISARFIEYQKSQKLQQWKLVLESVYSGKEYPPPPMRQVAKRLDTSVQTLYSYFPELCQKISIKYIGYRNERSEKRVDKLVQEIYQIALELHSSGIEPTASRISNHLSKSGSILQQEAIQAVKEIRCELGWDT